MADRLSKKKNNSMADRFSREKSKIKSCHEERLIVAMTTEQSLAEIPQ
jgi:hypothetical protein